MIYKLQKIYDKSNWKRSWELKEIDATYLQPKPRTEREKREHCGLV